MELVDGSDFAPITSAEHASSVILAMRARNRTVMVDSSTESVLRREDDSQIIAPTQNPTKVQVVLHLRLAPRCPSPWRSAIHNFIEGRITD